MKPCPAVPDAEPPPRAHFSPPARLFQPLPSPRAAVGDYRLPASRSHWRVRLRATRQARFVERPTGAYAQRRLPRGKPPVPARDPEPGLAIIGSRLRGRIGVYGVRTTRQTRFVERPTGAYAQRRLPWGKPPVPARDLPASRSLWRVRLRSLPSESPVGSPFSPFSFLPCFNSIPKKRVCTHNFGVCRLSQTQKIPRNPSWCFQPPPAGATGPGARVGNFRPAASRSHWRVRLRSLPSETAGRCYRPAGIQNSFSAISRRVVTVCS